MARRRFKRAGFNQKLIMDVGLAGLVVRVIPILLNKFVPLDPTIYTVAGAGGGWLVGSMLKKPDLANASIALGLVEFVAPMIEDLVGGITGSSPQVTGKLPTGISKIINRQAMPPQSVADYYSLNDYISNPSTRQSVDQYRTDY